MKKHFFTLQNLFLLYTAMIILLMALPLNSGEMNNIYILHFRSDYIIHAMLFIPWAFFGLFMKKSLLGWLFAGIIFGILSEGIQYLLPYRAFNVNDVLANVIGVLAGFGALIVYLRLRK